MILSQGLTRDAAQKIKKDLIQKAKLKTSYAKLKERELGITGGRSLKSVIASDQEPASLELHPERQAMLEQPHEELAGNASQSHDSRNPRRYSTPKRKPFAKETELAERRRAEAEARKKDREAAEEQRRQKAEERERFRRAMAKARSGGRNGQRKLGRESVVLLEKVKRVTSNL